MNPRPWTRATPRRGALDRRGFLGLGAVTAAAGLAGCGSGGGSGAEVFNTTTYIPASYDDLYVGIEAFMDTATEQAEGAVSFEMFNSGTLLGAEQLLPGLLLGVTDVMFQTSSYISSSYPILGAMELPFVTADFEAQRAAIAPDGDLTELINEVLRERGVRLLGSLPTTFEYFWTVDAPIRKPEDVAGMRIRVAGEIEGETVLALGGAPVSMGSAEVYEALERGTIDGMMSYLGTVYSRDLQTIIRYGTQAHFGAYTVDAWCRADWYDEQDATVQGALTAAGEALYGTGTDHMVEVHEGDYLPAIRDAGVEIIELEPTELEVFTEALDPVYDRWREAIGDPDISDRALAAVGGQR